MSAVRSGAWSPTTSSAVGVIHGDDLPRPVGPCREEAIVLVEDLPGVQERLDALRTELRRLADCRGAYGPWVTVGWCSRLCVAEILGAPEQLRRWASPTVSL